MKRLLLVILIHLTTIPLFAESEIVAFRLTSENGLPDNNIRRIYQDSCGYICLFGRYNAFLYDGYSFSTLSLEDATKRLGPQQKRTSGDRPDSEFRDNMGNHMQLTTNGDLLYTDLKSGKQFRFNVVEPRMFQLTKNLKCHVITDRRGLIWVSTNGGGLTVYDSTTHTARHINRNSQQPNINSDFLVDMMEDRDGNIWVTAENYGVTCLKVRQRNYDVISINSNNTEKGNWVRMLRRIDDRRILIADMEGRLIVSDDELKTTHPYSSEQRNYIAACLDSQGRLWLGSRDDGVTIDGQHYDSGRIDCIVLDRQGRMWVCGLKSKVGLATLSANGQYSKREFLNDIKDLDPRTMLVDHRGDLWIGTRQGLYVCSPDSLVNNPKRYTRVMDGQVMCLYESSEKYIWVGTAGRGAFYAPGNKYRASQFKQVSIRDGLANNIVQGISETPQQHLTIATEDGLSFIDPFKRQIHNLFFSDSRLRNIFSERSIVRLSDGRMAFGSLDGIVVTNQVEQQAAKRHRLLITGLDINGSSIYDMDNERPFEGDISQVKHLSLSHDQNSLTFYFSNLGYGEQRLTTYQCRLEGFDRDWQNLSNRNQTTYKNLTSGTYILHVRSTEVAGEDYNETTLTIRILPPWWRTWWAYLIYLCLGAAIALAIYRQVRHIAKLRQHIAVEKEVTEYKLKFFTNISHEFRTPLTLIQGSMDRLKQLPDSPASARAPLSNMQRNVDRMLRLINQLLEFRRMQNNRLSLSLEETDVVAFVYNICQTFHDVSENQQIALAFSSSAKSIPMYIDRGFVDKAVYNLLSNAFKFTPKKGSVMVKVNADDTQCKIQVIDTGVGVPEEQRERIFNRFERGQLRSDSLGIGLDLTAELIRTHHGTINCEANPQGGSIFTITLPTDKGIYNANDFLAENAPNKNSKDIERQGYQQQALETMPEPMNEHRILAVEDDGDIATFLKQELGKYFIVDTAADGKEALEKIQEEQQGYYSLVITDVMMPRMNGYELLKHLRHDNKTSHLPIIMLTALDAEDNQMKGMEAGADAYITKPFSLQLLLLQCRNLIQRGNQMKDIYAQEEKPSNRVTPEVVIEERDHKLMAQLEVWVDAHLAAPDLSVDKFAADMKYGRTNFYSKLKTLTGQTPNEYIKERRLQRALHFLEDEHVTVAEVAYQVGMGTPQYLSTCFKKRFGVTPTQYQKGK